MTIEREPEAGWGEPVPAPDLIDRTALRALLMARLTFSEPRSLTGRIFLDKAKHSRTSEVTIAAQQLVSVISAIEDESALALINAAPPARRAEDGHECRNFCPACLAAAVSASDGATVCPHGHDQRACWTCTPPSEGDA